MKPRHDYEWEIRGFQLIRGQLLDSHLGVERADTKEEAIAKWENGRGRKVKASCIQAILAPDLLKVSRRRLSAVALALASLGSLALTSEPAWGMSDFDTLGIHTPTPPALVGEGAIFGPVAQWLEQSVYNGQVDGSTPSRITIFTGETRDEAKQERNYGTTRPSLEPIDHGETCKAVYANHTQTECVTAGETAPLSQHTPLTGRKTGDHARPGNLPRPGVLGFNLSTVDAGNAHTASLPSVRKPPGYPARVGGPSQDGTNRSCNRTPIGKLADGGQYDSPSPWTAQPEASQLAFVDGCSGGRETVRWQRNLGAEAVVAGDASGRIGRPEPILASRYPLPDRSVTRDHDGVNSVDKQRDAVGLANALGVLSVVACGMAALLVLACGAMGGER